MEAISGSGFHSRSRFEESAKAEDGFRLPARVCSRIANGALVPLLTTNHQGGRFRGHAPAAGRQTPDVLQRAAWHSPAHQRHTMERMLVIDQHHAAIPLLRWRSRVAGGCLLLRHIQTELRDEQEIRGILA